jgi:peptide/nickel transport system permease protein
MNFNMKYNPVVGKRAAANIQLRIGVVLLGLLLASMVVASLWGPVSIDVDVERRLEPLSLSHPLGTDELGRDILSCVLYGVAISISIGFAVVVLSAAMGLVVGTLSGYFGGWVDSLLMRIVDMLLAFPGILLAIAFASLFPRGMVYLIFILCITGWVEYARLARGEVLKQKTKAFIPAAICYNASSIRIVTRYLLPVILPLIIAQASAGIAGVILAESSLNFLGIGIEAHLPTLGKMLDTGRNFLFNHPVMVLAPGVILFLLISGFSFLGEGLKKKLIHPTINRQKD